MLFLLLTIVTSILLFATSYAWFDHGLMTMLAQSKPYILHIDQLRKYLIYNRHVFELIFILMLISLFLIQITSLYLKKIKIKWLFLSALLITLIASLAYPFLSHDIFSYLFSAKILYFYRQNPYTTIPEVFRDVDTWLFFLRWTHKSYIYGPLYLAYSTIPFMFASANKFISLFIGLKLLNAFVFLFTGAVLLKRTKRKRLVYAYWFFNPLLLIEMLVNSHNELLMISLFILSVVLFEKNKFTGFLVYLASVLTKFVSIIFIPTVILKEKARMLFFKFSIFAMSLYFAFTFKTTQAWYYTWIYMAIPFANFKRRSFVILFIFQILLIYSKYFGFVSTGGWSSTSQTPFMIISFLVPFFLIFTEKTT